MNAKMQKQNVFEKRNNHGKFKFVLFSFGIKLCFDERYQERFFCKRNPKQLGLKRYEPVWAMVHKLRKTMGNRDAKYTLEGMIEFDEAYFTVESSEIEQEKEFVEKVQLVNKMSQ